MVLYRLCLTAILILALVSSESDKYDKDKENVKIKIVESPALSRFPSMPSYTHKTLTLRADPSPLTGPPHLLQLNNQCYTVSDKGYTYKLCMFNNITQKEDRVGWNSFYGVLGVWHEWIIENDTFSGMHYTMGDSCGRSEREAKIIFNCSPYTSLHNITEPSTCSYKIFLNTPLACFKGAMQVYHLLSSEQLKQWEKLDHLYYGDEITFKGLTEKRRKLLVEAGLLQEGKKEATTKPPRTEPPPSASLSELAKCQKEMKSMKEEMKALKSSVLKIVKGYPDVYARLRTIFNSTIPLPVNSSHPPSERSRNLVNDAALRKNEESLSDQFLDTLLEDLTDPGNLPSKKTAVKKERGEREEQVDQEMEALIKNMDIEDL